MYLSHPVRRMREDPLPDEEVTLVVELGNETDRQAIAAVVDDYGGAIEHDLRFADLAVRVPETGVAPLCEIDGIERIETENTLSLGLEVEN